MKNIKYLYRAVLIIIFLYFIIHDGISQVKQPKQAINVCAIAIPVMNFYVLNYEYLYQSRHGLAARLEYAPKMKGAETTGVALAGVLNYRWHFTPIQQQLTTFRNSWLQKPGYNQNLEIHLTQQKTKS